jgi:vitamin B12 transporter
MKKRTLSLLTATLLASSTTAQEITLDPILVTTATKTSQDLSEITANMEVISALDIQERGFTTLTQALSSLSGISSTTNGGVGQTSAIYLRGMASKDTLVLIDGIRYNDPSSLVGASFGDLMLHNIEQIEVVKGAQSGIWGADASAGVVNIITQKPTQKGVSGSAYVEGGAFDTTRYGASVAHTSEDYSVQLSHSLIDTKGFSAQSPKGEPIDQFEKDGYKNQTTSLQVDYAINETNSITLSHTLIDTEGDYDTFDNPDSLAISKSLNQFSSINFHHVDSFNTFNLYGKRSTFDKEFTDSYGSSTFKGKSDEIGANSKIPYGKGEGNFLLIGADYKQFEQRDSINESFDNSGLFITNHNSFEGVIGGRTLFTQSLRYDNYSTFDNTFTGKVGIKHIHERIKGLTTAINYGTAYSTPTLYQLYAPATSFGSIGNPNLEPEESQSFDLSIAYKELRLSYFNTRIENLIQYTTGYNNLKGESKIDGFEVGYNRTIGEDIYLTFNYTHLLHAQDQEGEPLLRRAKDTLNASIDYYGIRDLRVGLHASYIGDRDDMAFNLDYSTSEVSTGNYTLFNLTADYKLTKGMELYAKIENLTDEDYQSIYGYASAPRGLYVGIRASF